MKKMITYEKVRILDHGLRTLENVFIYSGIISTGSNIIGSAIIDDLPSVLYVITGAISGATLFAGLGMRQSRQIKENIEAKMD